MPETDACKTSKASKLYDQDKDPVIFVLVTFTSGWERGIESDPVPYSSVIILNTENLCCDL